MVMTDFSKQELNIIHWTLSKQLERLEQLKKEGHNVNEAILRIMRDLLSKTLVLI